MDLFQIRKATIEDAGIAAVIVRRSIQELCFADHGGVESLLQRWLSNKNPENFRTWIDSSAVSFLAQSAGGTHGFALMTPSGELALLYVTPDLIHRGAGKALLAACEPFARDTGIQAILLSSTRTARAFYQLNGFSEIGPAVEGDDMSQGAFADTGSRA